MSLIRAHLHASVAVLLVIASWSDGARADEKEACVAASEQAQTLRDEGKLRATRAQLLACSRDACPAIVRKDCDKWLAEVDAAMPTVVLGARDPKGNDVVGARVTLDGAPLADHLDGRAVPVDPGEHVFHYEAPGSTPVEQRAVIRVGEKNRMLTAILSPVARAAPVAVPPTPSTTSTSNTTSNTTPTSDSSSDETASSGGGVPAGTWILGGLGVAALGSFAYFGLTGRSDIDSLRSTCAPNCAQSDVDAAHTKLLVADVSLGVGVVALAAATYFFLRRDTSPPAVVDVQARAGGATLTLGARF